ncbi:Imm1 family immunity protein [Amycolatopsis sp. NBC_01307]|uniref:Imm1 family immunity protein n=1 Tax=Amycolatopsis sp. NBC_01307 TaxID=2903561 RepID=UPI002E0D6D79|nr:Imm1 family immunity protein [Amycolatopsis sp. NBC_01307]
MIKAQLEGHLHTEDLLTVADAADLDALLDRVAAAGPLQLARLIVDGDPEKGLLTVGINMDRGFLRHYRAGEAVTYSHNPSPYPLPDYDEVIYYLDRAEEFAPDDAEVPFADVRRGAHEFLRSGGARPAGLKPEA